MKLPRVTSFPTLLGVGLLSVTSLVTLSAQPIEIQGHAQFSKRARGREALDMIQSRLGEVARLNRIDEQALSEKLKHNRDLWVDRGGRLLYSCEGLAVFSNTAAAGAIVEEPLASAIPNSTDSFKLHSLPGANRIIYLDFNGHTTTGTRWNTNQTGGAPIVSAPFDFDGNPSSFSTAELDRIKKIWQRVAEDYAPFAIDVTTEEPPLESLRRTSTSDQVYGVRVVISPTSSWFSPAGGVAFVGSFNWDSDTPAFVFSNNLGPNSEKAIAEASAHEAGHTLGLHHDGKTDGTAYYAGQGDWAPIMGVSYYKPISQWSRGEYAGANNTEDDLAVMQRFGAPLLVDDHGNTTTTATTLTGPTVTAVAIIGTRTDVDVFRFNSAGGTVSLALAGTSPQPNLDIKAELLNSAGTVIATSNPTGLSATLTATVGAGTYFLRVDGVGVGDPVTTGYSDYASLGEYTVTGRVQ